MLFWTETLGESRRDCLEVSGAGAPFLQTMSSFDLASS